MHTHDTAVIWGVVGACRALTVVLGLAGSQEISRGSPYGGPRQASLPMALQELALIASVLWRLRSKPSQEYKMCSRKQVVAATLHATLRHADVLTSYLQRLSHIMQFSHMKALEKLALPHYSGTEQGHSL